MRNYEGLKNKLKLDLYSRLGFYPLEIRCNAITQDLDRIIGYNLYDYVKVADKIQEISKRYKEELVEKYSDEELEEQRKIPDSPVNLYVEMKSFCEMLLDTYKLLNDLDLLEYIISYFKNDNKEETSIYLKMVLEDIDEYILNSGVDGLMLKGIYTRLSMISYEIETHEKIRYKPALSIINNIYIDLKTLMQKN